MKPISIIVPELHFRPCFLYTYGVPLGCRQVVRHRVLVPAFGGSNPSIPAKEMRSASAGLFSCPRLFLQCTISVQASAKISRFSYWL